MPTKTRWGVVLALILAGVIAALQIGKAAIAAPVLQQDLSLTLVVASWVIGAYAVLGTIAGLPVGVAVSLFAPRTAVLTGLVVCGLASLAGAFAPSGTVLIATRVLEGCGFLVTALSIPALIRSVTEPKDGSVALALFACYLPVGSALMMLTGPLLLASGWQTLWLVNGVVALLYALVLSRIDFDAHSVSRAPKHVLANLRNVLGSPGPILLALTFGLYTFQYSAITGLLPTLLVQELGLSISAAGIISAVTVAANAVGNVSAGALARWRIPLWSVVAAAFICLGIAGFGIFSQALPVALVALSASLSLGLTGLIPGSVFAAAPKLAPTSALLVITLGLVQQISNLGNLFGPAALAAFVERFGWHSAPFVFVGVMVIGIAFAVALRLVLRRTPP